MNLRTTFNIPAKNWIYLFFTFPDEISNISFNSAQFRFVGLLSNARKLEMTSLSVDRAEASKLDLERFISAV